MTRHDNASTGSAHGFEDKNILEFVGDLEQRPALANTRRRLFEAGSSGCILVATMYVGASADDQQFRRAPKLQSKAAGLAKVLTSWNCLMLAAFAEAARVLDRDDYRQVAVRNAEFLLRELRQENGRLLRTWKRRPELVEGAARPNSMATWKTMPISSRGC